jgi:amino acid transporter
LTAIALGFGGIEVAAFYVQETKNPQRTFPIATLIAAIIIITIYLLGSLALAAVIPSHEIELSSGMMQAMSKFFSYLEIPWIIPLFAFFSVIGGLALLNTWILGPSKGLHTSALSGDLPGFTKKVNQRGAPIAILLLQAIIGTLLISLYLFIPTMNHFYWIFQTLAAQLILLMYLMIFASVIKLRYSQPHTPRLYKIPGKKWGVWLIAGIGSLFCITAFFLGFLPPEEYRFLNQKTYSLILTGGLLFFCSPPLIWQAWQKYKQ